MMQYTVTDLLDAIARRDELPETSRAELDEILSRAVADWNDRKRQEAHTRALSDLAREMKRANGRR